MKTISRSIVDVVLLHQCVEVQAAQRPDQVAVEQDDRFITYRELYKQSLKLASLLRDVGVGRNDRVGFLIDNGIEACLAIVGILRADGCYVPLAPNFPPARLASIVDDADMKALVVVGRYLDNLFDVLDILEHQVPRALVMLDVKRDSVGPQMADTLEQAFRSVRWADDLAAAPADPGPNRNVEEDLAYIMYTSGTTGRPKGVMLTHANVKSFLSWAVDYFNLSHEDRMSNHSAVSFDLSVFDIFGCFLVGATLCPVVDASARMFPGGFIINKRISVWFSVPSVIGMMRQARQLIPGAFDKYLRVAIFCGEALIPEYARVWRETHPSIPIVNLYGPTEAAIACTFYNVGVDGPFEPDKRVPIGRPCRDTEILILNPEREEAVEPGRVGRLMICGSQVAPGYWRRPDSNAKSFIINPEKREFGARMYESGDLAYVDEQGMIQYVGRADSQVKYMGHRIELSEIEVVLNRHPLVIEAAVCFIEGATSWIVGAVTLCADEDLESPEKVLEDYCGRYLPLYMIPKYIKCYQVLPKNANGKIDRKAISARVVEELSLEI